MHGRRHTAARTTGLIAGMIVAAVAWVLPIRAADEVFDRTVPLRSGGSFALQNVNGSVTIIGWDRDAVEVRAVKSSPGTSAELAVSDLARVQVGIDAKADRVVVTTTYPKDEHLDVSVTYNVLVPRDVWLQEVATVNGAVYVRGVQGDGQLRSQLRSVNGDVEVSDSGGPFSVRTTNGNIHMAVARLTAPAALPRSSGVTPVRVETVNGSIVLAVPAATSASLDVRCLSGDFYSDLPAFTLAGYTPRAFQATLGSGGAPVRLSTVNGAIRIASLPQGI